MQDETGLEVVLKLKFGFLHSAGAWKFLRCPQLDESTQPVAHVPRKKSAGGEKFYPILTCGRQAQTAF